MDESDSNRPAKGSESSMWMFVNRENVFITFWMVFILVAAFLAKLIDEAIRADKIFVAILIEGIGYELI